MSYHYMSCIPVHDDHTTPPSLLTTTYGKRVPLPDTVTWTTTSKGKYPQASIYF